MTSFMPSKKILPIVGATLAMLGVYLPTQAQAAVDITTLIGTFMGSALSGGSSSRFVNGDPASQVIPLLQQIYLQNADNGGVDNNGKRLQTETAMKIADYQEQNQWKREDLLRQDEIARSYPEMSNLSCAVATANQSAPIIDAAADNVTAQVRQILGSGMYSSVFSGTPIAERNKALIWCKLGSTGIKGKCDIAATPLTANAELGHDFAITDKDSIPCDMPGVIQEFEKMKNPEKWQPNPKHKECVAAILSIAQERKSGPSRPTKEEASNDEGTMVWGRATQLISARSGTQGGIFQKFKLRVSVPTTMGCEKGIHVGGKDMYSLLQKAYGSQKREPVGDPNFGLPPSDFCISKKQFLKGHLLMAKEHEIERPARNINQLLEDQIAINLIHADGDNDTGQASVAGISSNGLDDVNETMPGRRVGTSENEHHEELLGAIRQLTREIQKMNTGLYADKLQEVSVKKGTKRRAPVDTAVSDKAAEVTDALKEMGIKVSQPATGRALAPITQEFPVLPPQ